MQNKVITEFTARFRRKPDLVVRAPGRVNLLGGHTDYNEGFVLPVAIDRDAWVAASRLTEPEARVLALDMQQEVSFSLEPVPPADGSWADYPRGVSWALRQDGLPLAGIEALLASQVPVGAGLSSSAAIEIAFAWAWQSLAGGGIDRTRIAVACQKAENEYVGVNCGVMDQMAAAWGLAGHALLLDCRSLEVVRVPLPAGVAIVVLDSGVRRELASSEYNRRRNECEQAVEILLQHLPGIKALRDVSVSDFAELEHLLPDVPRMRARHVVTDNARVLGAVEALRQGDLVAVGEAMRLCHGSLRDDYQVSSSELDLLAETAWRVPGCYGARLTGAGFGGCVVALAKLGAVDELTRRVGEAYQEQFGRLPAATVCASSDGVAVVPTQ
jgi:galactokinase